MRSIPRSQKLFFVFIAMIFILTGCYSKENFDSRNSVRHESEFAGNISDQNVNEFLSSVKKVDGNVEAKYQMARYFQKRNRYKIALQELKEIIRMDPTFVKAYNAMGISYEASGDFKRAIQSYEHALKINPNLDYVHNNIGFAYLIKKNYDLAIDAFQKAIVLNNHNKRFRNNLGFAYAKSGQFDRALEQFRLTGDEFSANYKLGQILYREGQYEEALKYSEKAYQVKASAQILSSVSNADKDYSPQAAFALDEKNFRSQSKLAQSNAQQAPLISDENKTAQIIDSDPENNRDDSQPADQTEEPQPNKIIVEVEITVSNGNGIDGMASRLGSYLSEKSFRVTRLKNAKCFNHEKTKIFYYNGYLQDVQRLLQEIPWHQDLNQLIELKQMGNQIKILIGKDVIPYDEMFSKASSTRHRS
jgi:Flp pilus assembly protein TadD